MENKQFKKDILLSVIIAIGVIILLGIGASLYQFLDDEFERKGGMRLVLGVVTEDAIVQELDWDALSIMQELKSKEIAFDSSRRGEGFFIKVNGVDSTAEKEARNFLNDTFDQSYEIRSGIREGKIDFTLSFRESEIRQIREATVRRVLATLKKRLDEFGITKPRLRIYGESKDDVRDQIVVELPGVDDPERVKELIGKTGLLEVCLVKKDGGGPFPSVEIAYEANSNTMDEYQVLSYVGDSKEGGLPEYIVVSKYPVITGSDLRAVHPSKDMNGDPAISFFLRSEGADRFGEATADHIGESLAIVLDKRIYSYPTITERIGGEGIITGSFTQQEAEDLALLLKSGALPASIQLLQESYVPPVND